jgi:hypothetical protein
MKISMRKVFATAAIAVVGAVPFVAGPLAGAQQPVASVSCANAKTPGGTKCLQPGEFCSHKSGYAAAYKKAGYRCNSKGRLEYR